MDRAVSLTVLARVWSSGAGVVTVLLIARFLSSSEQGYYYTFGSLVALQVVFELGFSFVVMQMASHESARLTIDQQGHVEGDADAHARLASILHKAVLWYVVAAFLLLAFLLPAGLFFFQGVGVRDTASVSWVWPWIAVAVMASINLLVTPLFSFFEGLGYVPEVAAARLLQSLIASFLGWSALVSGHGLYVPACTIFGQLLYGILWILRRRIILRRLWCHRTERPGIGWWTEVWPFQWRIAISWISGYFIFQLFNPILFAYQGPVVAGQMGMCLSITSAISAVALSWIVTKAAPFGTMIARKAYEELDRMFYRALWQSATICITTSIIFWGIVLVISTEHLSIVNRLLNPLPLAFLLLTVICNHFLFSEAIYLRAHKQECFLFVSIGNAIIVGSSTWYFGKYQGVFSVCAAYFVTSLASLVTGTYLFLTKQKEWHSA